MIIRPRRASLRIRAFQPQFLHAGFQRCRLQPENLRRTTGAADAPPGRFHDSADMLALDVREFSG